MDGVISEGLSEMEKSDTETDYKKVFLLTGAVGRIWI